jgi:MoaA/NifB/PqqE/SkfB family radical SAM enzyme
MNATVERDTEELTTAEWIGFADNLINAWHKNIEVAFTWGEALTHPDFEEILQYYSNVGFRCLLVTNGTLLTEERYQRIWPYLRWFTISIDGTKEFHDSFRWRWSFDLILKHLEFLKKEQNKKQIHIKTVISKQNIQLIPELFSLLKSYNIQWWTLISLRPYWRWKSLDAALDRNDLIKLEWFISENKDTMKFIFNNPLKWKEERRCRCWVNEFSVLYNWDIVACLNWDRTKQKIYGKIGNKQIQDIETIWWESFKEERSSDFLHCKSY